MSPVAMRAIPELPHAFNAFPDGIVVRGPTDAEQAGLLRQVGQSGWIRRNDFTRLE